MGGLSTRRAWQELCSASLYPKRSRLSWPDCGSEMPAAEMALPLAAPRNGLWRRNIDSSPCRYGSDVQAWQNRQLTLFTGGGGNAPPPGDSDIPLADEVERRYLNYALSVITSRALPDVRDGLKPVQRRILYAMYNNLHLVPEGRYKKCATVVGDVLGKFHPHGDTAAYDAMVRMAQDFSLRYPLVDGQGNFGSLDGDFAAAYRYTNEAKLRAIAIELLGELKAKTVAMRPNFDGQLFEPVVLPARIPNLLVNGAQGIAVGMATSIPPHNLGEVCDALLALIDDSKLEVKDLVKYIKGPDFPTGGELVCARADLRDIYENGQGTLRSPRPIRGRRRQARASLAGHQFDSVRNFEGDHRRAHRRCHCREKAAAVARCARRIDRHRAHRLRDQARRRSGIDHRLFVQAHAVADERRGQFDLLGAEGESGSHRSRAPRSQKDVVALSMDFRFETVTKAHRSRSLTSYKKRRIHLLGIAFEGHLRHVLDETIRIIRKSDGKQDAAEKLMARFGLDEEQVEAILELKLYRLAKLEILVIEEELAEKKKEAQKLEAILKSEARRWAVVKTELQEVREKYADKRLTKVIATDSSAEFSAEAFIIHEDANVVVTRDGWVKRAKEIKDVSATRVREGDSVMTVLFGSTKKPAVFFTNFGSAYVCRIHDIPASTGYGEPIQKLFKFDDGEHLIGALSLDERMTPGIPELKEGEAPDPAKGPFLLAVTKARLGLALLAALARRTVDTRWPSLRQARRGR